MGKVCFLQPFLYPGKEVEVGGTRCSYIKIDLQSHNDPFGSDILREKKKRGEKRRKQLSVQIWNKPVSDTLSNDSHEWNMYSMIILSYF